MVLKIGIGIGYFRFKIYVPFKNATSGLQIIVSLSIIIDSSSTSENYFPFRLKSTTDPYFQEKFWFSITSGYERDFL